MMSHHTAALFEYLKPLQAFLSDPLVCEISINEPGCIFVEKQSEMTQEFIEQLTYQHLRGLADLIARFYCQVLSEESPILSATLPSGHRIQIIIPPACEAEKVILSFRKTVTHQLTLDDFARLGTFNIAQPCYLKSSQKKSLREEDSHLMELFQQKDYVRFLKETILLKKNIIISGGTSSGKTTLLNACLQEAPPHERLITLEDVREIKIPHKNAVHLLSSHVSLPKLIETSLRLRPDRLIIGEIRGQEVVDFCHANQTGHSGSIVSIHADHPAQVFDRVVQLTRRYSSNTLSRQDILMDWINLIDVIVQMKRERNKRVVSQIYFANASQA